MTGEEVQIIYKERSLQMPAIAEDELDQSQEQEFQVATQVSGSI